MPEDNDYINRASVLAEALPHIQKYNKKTVVIKYGGSAMVSQELCKAVISDVIWLWMVGVRVAVVHGGGAEINEMLERVGKKPKFVDGLRYTDEETMDIVQQVLCGRVNKNLAATMTRTGGKAVGLCGLDNGLFQAVQLDEKYGLVGKVVKVNPEPVIDCFNSGCIPVVSTVALGVDQDVSYNINADTAASELAIALGAERLLLLTDVRGLLRDKNDDSTLIREVKVSAVRGLIKDGIITGGMIPKVDCCVEAVRSGVSSAVILDGRIPHSILIELLSDEGIGTLFK